MEQDNLKKVIAVTVVLSVIGGTIFGAAAGFLVGSDLRLTRSLSGWLQGKLAYSFADSQTVRVVNEDSAVVEAVDKVSPAVVSIIITKDLPKLQRIDPSPFDSDFFRQFFGDAVPVPQVPQYLEQGTERTEVGGGTGFIVSADGYIVTNRHVVNDQSAEYTVLMNNGKRYNASVLARDSFNDLAVLRIQASGLPTVEFGDSAKLKVGQTVIAIGNALGEFRNTVSKGVISGLARSVVAGGSGIAAESLANVIQTDASINIGNSGGPLTNIAGQVIGINTAVAEGAQNIGFAIPINELKNAIESVQKTGRIVRPWLGVRYLPVTEELAQANKLSVDYGALVSRGTDPAESAVIPGSPADKAGIVENDIILEINGQKVTADNALAQAIARFNVGEEITLKLQRQGKLKDIKVKLEEMK